MQQQSSYDQLIEQETYPARVDHPNTHAVLSYSEADGIHWEYIQYTPEELRERAYETDKAGDRLYYSGTDRLYKVRDGKGHTTQADWTPDAVPALYTVIDVAHAGTQDNPIPAERGMEYVYGLYYTDSEDGKLYLCQRTGEAAGGTVVLQYIPHELVGHYFAEV